MAFPGESLWEWSGTCSRDLADTGTDKPSGKAVCKDPSWDPHGTFWERAERASERRGRGVRGGHVENGGSLIREDMAVRALCFYSLVPGLAASLSGWGLGFPVLPSHGD